MFMTPNESFLQAICENPDDDAPRLVYADWLDEQGRGEAAEFIRAQIEITRVTRGSRRFANLRRRALKLLAEHGRAWLQEVPKWARNRCEFRRGFVAHVACTALQFIRHGELLLRSAPVQSLKVRRGGGRIPQLAETPSLSCITALGLYGNNINSQDVEALAASPHLRRLTTLRLGSYLIGAEGARALAASPFLTNLTSLELSGSGLYEAGFRELAAAPWLARLNVLKLDGDYARAAGIRALLASPYLPRLAVLSLYNNYIRDEGVAMLANSPLVEELLTLNLPSNSITAAGAAALAASSRLVRLTKLDLAGNRIGDAGARALLEAPHLGNLRRLSVHHCDIDAAKDALRQRFGNRVRM